MSQSIRIPCIMMRGGTSRGAFFLASDLPSDLKQRDEVLMSAMGAGHELQVDGIGGGNPLTSKVAIVGPSARPDADVDYLFAQVNVLERDVDTSPNCGNMLSAVGPFAIEQGLIHGVDGRTIVRIYNVNTGKLIDATVETPGGHVTYDGNARIDGVPGSAAPIHLTFLDSAGAKTGSLLPTGRVVDIVAGVEVTCIDAAMPLVIVRAQHLGKTGWEQPAELDSDHALLQRLNEIRILAGERMGLSDVARLVIPKPVMIAPPNRGGTIAARYFMPHSCHKAFAVTGAVGLAMACVTDGTVAADLAGKAPLPRTITIEHPSGQLDLKLDKAEGVALPVASVLRTARRIFEGAVFARISDAAAPAAT